MWKVAENMTDLHWMKTDEIIIKMVLLSLLSVSGIVWKSYRRVTIRWLVGFWQITLKSVLGYQCQSVPVPDTLFIQVGLESEELLALRHVYIVVVITLTSVCHWIKYQCNGYWAVINLTQHTV